MNKAFAVTLVKRIILAAVVVGLFTSIAYGMYLSRARKLGLKTIRAAETSDAVTENRKASEEYLFQIREAPTEVYFLNTPIQSESVFYGGRLYVPFEETYNAIAGLISKQAEEDYGVIFNNFVFNGYGDEKINPYFLEVEDECYISFYKLVKGMGLCAYFDSENDKAYICYRKTDISDVPKLTKAEDSKPALLRLEDITPDGYCKDPRYTDEGLEKLRAVGEYLERREQKFYVAAILRYINPEEGIDLDLTKMTNTYTADFLYTLDYLTDKGGSIVIHGYTHQHGDYFSADGFEFGFFSDLSTEEKADRLLMAKDNAHNLGYDDFRWEFPHYGANACDIKMSEETYSVIFQSKNKVFRSDYMAQKKASDGHIVTYVPLPAYYLNNIYELDDMLERITKCEEKGCVVGLFFHPSIDFEKIIIETTPWGVRNWYYTPYWALPVITDKVISDGYTFSEFEDLL